MNYKELKTWLAYPRWKAVHDKLVDQLLSIGGDEQASIHNDFLPDGNVLTYMEMFQMNLKDALDNHRKWGRSSVEEVCKEFLGHQALYDDEYLYEVQYNAWDCELKFFTVKLVGENKGGYVFKSYSEVEFYDKFCMPGALTAIKTVRR